GRRKPKRKPSANQSANQIPHDVRSFADRYLRGRKPSRKPNRLSPALARLPLDKGICPPMASVIPVGLNLGPRENTGDCKVACQMHWVHLASRYAAICPYSLVCSAWTR